MQRFFAVSYNSGFVFGVTVTEVEDNNESIYKAQNLVRKNKSCVKVEVAVLGTRP